MKKLTLLLFISFVTVTLHAQIKHDIMIGGGFDFLKSDYDGLFSKAQLGVEINYFLDRKFTATTGMEVWTKNQASAVIGGRWYLSDKFFVRARGLIGVNDLSLGAGWNKNITDNLRFEALGDFYFHADFSVRAGVAYVFRRRD